MYFNISAIKCACIIPGAPPEFAEKIMNDSKALLCIKADGAFHCHSYKFSACPMELSFKVGEEFEFKNPVDPTDISKVKHDIAGNLINLFIKSPYVYLTFSNFLPYSVSTYAMVTAW